MILGHNGPLIWQQLNGRLARINHRLDGENHAGLEGHARSCSPVVQHLRLIMEDATDAVAAVLAND